MMNLEAEGHDIEGDRTFRIGELAAEFDVTLHTLRFYEDKGLIFPRRVGNTRIYSRADRARIRIILLGKRVGFSLADIKEILELYDPTGSNLRQLEVSVEKGEVQLGILKGERSKVDAAISELEETVEKLRVMIANTQR